MHHYWINIDNATERSDFMKLQFKIQDFQLQAVKAVVDCFKGQPLKSNKFTPLF